MIKIKSNLMKRKLFLNWLISYLAVLLVAITIVSVVFVRMNTIIKNEIDRGNELHLSKIQKAGDLRLNDMRNVALLIGFDDRVRTLQSVRNGFTSQNQLNIRETNKFLNTVRNSNNFIDQIYIYFKYNNTVISNSSHVESELAYRILNGETSMSYDQWKYIVTKGYSGSFENNLTIFSESGNLDAISYIQSIPVESVNNNSANIIIQFSQDKFNDVLKSVATSEEDTILLINSGKFIASTNKDIKFDLKNLEKHTKKSGVYYDKINNENMVISFIDSEIPGYRYISIMPKSLYFERVNTTRNIVLIITLFFIIVGAFGVYYIVRKNYKPINNIIESITRKLDLPMETQGDELSFIQSVLNNTMDQNDKIVKKMKETEDVIRSSFLERLLKGRVDENKITDDVLKEFNLNLETQNLAVLLIIIENHDIKDDLGQEMYEVKLLHFIITNVLEELINQKNIGMMVDLDNSTLACIINFRDIEKSIEENKKDVSEAIIKAQEFINEHFHIRFSVAASNIYNTFGGIPFAYREALHAMNHKAFMGEGNIIFYEDVANLGSFYEYSAETEYKLMNVIKEGNVTDARKIVDGIFESNFANSSLSLATGECLVFDLVGTLIKVVDDNVVMDKLQPISRLKNCSTIQQIKSEIISLIEYICEYFDQKNKTKSEYKLSMEVMEFINENYKNENLNVSMIGDHFNMTSNYLSRMFKTQVNEGLHNYIERIRIEKSKGLIANEKLNILDIAKEVGYSNSKTFIRVFKKIEGTTPGKYREMMNTK